MTFPLLTVYLSSTFSTDSVAYEDLVKSLNEHHIEVRNIHWGSVLEDIDMIKPRVYISVGPSWEECDLFINLPLHEKYRWLHFSTFGEIDSRALFYCWLSATEPLRIKKEVPNHCFSSEVPLVSVFTAACKSGDKIKRPYHSLLKQTYSNWEWVIVDDSGDGDKTYANELLDLNDSRVRRYRQDQRSGYIGEVKRYAAGLCKGEILVELDHDDELTSDCLQKIVDTFIQNPDCGFAFGWNAELEWGTQHSNWYGWDYAFGYGLYYRVWIHEMNCWQNVSNTSYINCKTIRHLVGLPNHPRAWTRECYHLVGGHRTELLVGDDYDLLVRTFLSTKFVVIPHLLYLQYRNDGEDNSTFQRNAQIQTVCSELEAYYHDRINLRLSELGLPSLENFPYQRVWEMPEESPGKKNGLVFAKQKQTFSYIVVVPKSDKNLGDLILKLSEEQGRSDGVEFMIVGQITENVLILGPQFPTGVIRWWPFEKGARAKDCISYAKSCISGACCKVVYLT